MERKADISSRRARADRANEFIDRELSREDAKSNVINSNADANRNISEGGRDMLKGIGKGVERHGLGK
jgi:ribosomal protein L31E